MAEQREYKSIEPEIPAERDIATETGPTRETSGPPNAYLKAIDTARKAAAVAMAVLGAAFVICVRRDDYLTGTLRWEPGIWAWGGRIFAIGVYGCLIATLGLLLEYLARPAKPWPFSLRWLFIRALLILITVTAVSLALGFAYGPGQAIGAAVGTFLLLAAMRERRMPRGVLASLAAVVLGLTLWGTQSAFQYARRHADQIVAAGCRLADRCPRTDYHVYNPRHELGMFAFFGQEISPSDPRVPEVLRKLGARRIWVDEERVAVYVSENAEFQIHRKPRADGMPRPVWGFRWKGATKIADRLWTNDY
jgi:hypothetical protein